MAKKQKKQRGPTAANGDEAALDSADVTTVRVYTQTLAKIVQLKAQLTLEHKKSFSAGDAVDYAVTELLKKRGK